MLLWDYSKKIKLLCIKLLFLYGLFFKDTNDSQDCRVRHWANLFLSNTYTRSKTSNIFCLFSFETEYVPSKHWSWWRRLEDAFRFVFKTFSRRLDQDQYIRLTHTFSEDVFKTPSRRLDQHQYIHLSHTLSRRLQDIFKTSSRRFQDVFNTSCKSSSKTSSTPIENVFKTSCKDVFKTLPVHNKLNSSS